MAGNNEYVEPLSQVEGVKGVDKVATVNSTANITNDLNGHNGGGDNYQQEVSYSPSVTLGMNNLAPQDVGDGSTQTSNTSKAAEDAAQQEAQVQWQTGVVRVADSPEAEEFLSAKQLYEKTLGVTQYDELRSKLHLRDDESFTDYYNRTHYVPKGYEVAAKLLLAEEKRKKLYAEVQVGHMSEEDFLYEAYGKDLLKQEGIDFSDSLYWYNKYKNGDYSDPRNNSTFMLQLIENARAIFQDEQWHKDMATKDLAKTLDGLVTGVELTNSQVQEIFADQFEELSKYYDDTAQIIKFYRGGLLKGGFNPLIDKDGDGKIDYYYAPDGKLYNVNETGQGANTYRAYYNSDGSLNRIVASSSVAGEMAGEFFKNIGKFFTGVVDLGALATGALVDVFDGGKFGDTLADWSASMGQFWNTTILKDTDYIDPSNSGWTTADGSFNAAVVGRQLSGLAGTITAFVVTAGLSSAIGAASKISAGVATELPKGLTGTTAKWLAKVGSSKALSSGLGKAAKLTVKTAVSTAASLTSWSNGAFGSTLGARLGTSLMLSSRDCLNSVATLAANQKVFGLSDSEVVTHAVGGAAVNFAATFFLRQVGDQGAMKAWGQMAKKVGGLQEASAAGAIAGNVAPNLFTKILTGTLSGGEKIGVGIANVVMDQVENAITAWTQSSLASTGNVFDINSLKNLVMNPSYIFNSLYQAHMSLSDELKIDKNKIIGATTDTSKMDQDFRRMAAEARQNNADNDAAIKDIDRMVVDYDKTIQTKMTEINPATKLQYTRAEATLFALEKAVVSMDLDGSNSFIKSCQDNVKQFITDQKIMYAQAVFNMANSNYQDYNKVMNEAFWGTKAFNWLYRRNSSKLINEYADAMQKYFAIPIDKQLFYDTYDTSYISQLTDSVAEQNAKAGYGEISKDLADISTGITSVAQDDKGHFEVGYTLKDVSDKAKATYTELIANVYGVNPDRSHDTWIRLKNDGSSELQKQRGELGKLLDAVAEVEAKIGGINENYNPFLIKLDDGTYVIPAIGGVGNQLDKIASTGLLFNTYRLAKFHYQENDSKALIKNIIDVVGVMHGDISSDIKSHLEDIRAVINALCGNGKALSEVDGARILNALMSDPRFEGLDQINTKEKGTSQFSTFVKLRDFEQKYIEARDAYNEIPKLKQDSKEYQDKLTIIYEFQNNYLRDKSATIRSIAEAQGAASSIMLNRLNSVPFQRGPQEGEGFVSLLSQIREAINAATTPEANKAVIEEFIERLGYKSTPISVNDMEAQLIGTIQDSLADLFFVGEEGARQIAASKRSRKARAAARKELGNKLREIYTKEAKALFDADKFSTDNIAHVVENIRKELDKEEYDVYKQKQIVQRGDKIVIVHPVLQNISDADATEIAPEIYNAMVDTMIDRYVDPHAKTLEKYKKFRTELDTMLHERLTSKKGINLHQLINLVETKLQKDYHYTIQDYKNIETMFTEDLAKVKKIVEKSTTIKARNLLVIDLDRVTGSETLNILSKFHNDKILDDFIHGDEASKLNQLFGHDQTKANAFKREMAEIKKLHHTYADSVLYFELDTPDDARIAEKLIGNLYNFNFTKRKANDIDLPGVYLLNKDTQGKTIKAQIGTIKSIADNYDATTINTAKVMPNDFFGIFESFVSGFNFITDNDKVTIDNIIINNMQVDSNTQSYTDVISHINHTLDVKLGKLAGQKVQNIALGYTAFGLADNTVDSVITKKHFVNRILEAASKYFDGENSAGIYTLKPNKKAKDYKDIMAIYEKFYNIQEDGNYLILQPKIDAKTFRQEAYKELEKNNKALPYILGINSKPHKAHNNLVGSSDGTQVVDQRTTGYTPYTRAISSLIEEFHINDIESMVRSVIDKPVTYKASDVDYEAAINALKNNTKTVSELISEFNENHPLYNNIYYQMEINALKASRNVTTTFVNRLKEQGVNNNVIKMIGDRNFRANLAIAMSSESVRKVLKFEDGYLKVTDELVAAIVKEFEPVQLKANAKDAVTTLDTEYTTTNLKQVLTGAQTGTINTGETIEAFRSEDIKKFLDLMNIDARTIQGSEDYNNPLATFYAMCLAASDPTDTQNISISLKDIHHLSNADCDIILNELKGKIPDKSYKDLEDIIYIIKTGDTRTEDNKLDAEEYAVVDRGEIKDKKMPSTVVNEVITKLTESIGDTKERNLFQRVLRNTIQRNYGKEELKISNTIDGANNHFAKKFYETISNTKMPNAENKGSILVANMNISSNRAALFSTLAHLTEHLRQSIKVDRAENQTMTHQEAAKLALDLYLYSTGDDYQHNYQQYILYNKRSHKIISSASNADKNDYDALVAELFMQTRIDVSTDDKTQFANGTNPNQPSTKDIVVISVPRNGLSSIFTPDLNPDIKVWNLNATDAYGQSLAKAFIDYSYSNHVQHLNNASAMSETELKSSYVDHLFSVYDRQAKTRDANTKKLASNFVVNNDVVDSVWNSINSYSSSTSTESLREQLRNAVLGIKPKNLTSLQQAEREMIAYGITDSVFNKQSGFKDVIDNARRETRKALGNIDTTNIDEFITAFKTGDRDTATLAATKILSTTKQEQLPSILKYIIANTNDIDFKMFILLGKGLDEYTDVNIKDTYTVKTNNGTSINLSKLNDTNTTTGDAETVYSDDGKLELPYQVALDIDGKVVEFFKPLEIEGLENRIGREITSGEQLAAFLNDKGFTKWYNDTYKEPGTKAAIQKLYEAYVNRNFTQNYNLLNQIKSENYFIGFNNKNFDNEILTKFFRDYPNIVSMIQENSLDLRELIKQAPTSIKFRFQKGEGTLTGSAETAGIKLNNTAHDASADIATTRELLIALQNNIVSRNHYQNVVVDKVQEIKDYFKSASADSRNTGLSKDAHAKMIDYIDSIEDSDIKFDIQKNLSDEEQKMFEQLLKFADPKHAIERLNSIVEYFNYRNSISASNMSDILTKSIRKQIFNSLSDGQIAFSNTVKNPRVKSEIKMLLSVAINKEHDRLIETNSKDAGDFEVAKKNVISNLLGTDIYRVSEDKLLKALSDKHLQNKLGITDTDISHYTKPTAEGTTRYTLDTDPKLNKYLHEAHGKAGILANREQLFKNSVNRDIYRATNDLVKTVDDIIESFAIKSKDGKQDIEIKQIEQYIKEELMNFFDVRSDMVQVERDAQGNIIRTFVPDANTGSVINAVAQMDQEAFDYLLQNPFLREGYKQIYRLVTASPINKELKLANSTKSSRLANDTLAITPNQLAKLMGVSNLTEQELRANLGVTTDQDIYIPVIRHPLDKTDSVQFLKLMLIEDGQGIEIAVNADTMLTRFNGDLDGDHIMILKPSKTMEAFANTKSKDGSMTLAQLQHEPLTLLHDALKTANISLAPEKDITYLENLLLHDTITNSKILNKLKDTYIEIAGDDTNILSKYEQQKADFTKFISELIDSDNKFKSNEASKNIDEIVDDIFWKSPIDMTGLNTGEERYVMFTDYPGVYKDDNGLATLNLQNRRRYRYGEISTYGTLRKNDSISGTLQKMLFNRTPVDIDNLYFVENIIRLAGSTKSALNNLDTTTQDSLLKNLLVKVGLDPKEADTRFKNIENFATKVEQVLVYKQLLNMEARQKLAGDAIKSLQDSVDNTPENRFFKAYLNPNEKVEGMDLAIKDILDWKHQLKSSYQRETIDTDEIFDNTIRLLANRVPNGTSIDESKKDNDIYTQQRVLYIVPNSNIKLTSVEEEDTVQPLKGLKNFVAQKPKYVEFDITNPLLENVKVGDTLSPKQQKALHLEQYGDNAVRVIHKEGNQILVSIIASLEGQKVMFRNNANDKATITTYADDFITGVRTDSELSKSLKDFAFVKRFGKNKFKKLTDQPLQNKDSIVYYDKDSNIITNAKDITDPRVAAFSILEDTHPAEIAAFNDQSVSESSFEELAHGNNITALNGVLLWHGKGYKVNDDGTIDFSNKALLDINNKMQQALFPSRTDANAYDFYNLLKLLVCAQDSGLTRDELLELYSHGPSAWENFTNKTIGKYKTLTTRNLKNALLSKELKDFVESSVVKRTNALADKIKATSENSADKAVEKQSMDYTKQISTGMETDLLNQKTNFKAKPFISRVDFLNELNRLAGNNSSLSRYKLQQADSIGMLNNGEFQSRTQTSNGPRPYYDSELNANNNSRYEVKVGDLIKPEVPTNINYSMPFSDDYVSQEWEFTGHQKHHFHTASNPLNYTKPIDFNDLSRVNGALELLATNDLNSDIDYALLFSKKKTNALASIKTEHRGFDTDGNISNSYRATPLNGKTTPENINAKVLLDKIKDLGKSSSYYDRREEFKKQVTVDPNIKLNSMPDTKYPTTITDDFNVSPLAADANAKTDIGVQQELLRQSFREEFKEATTIEEVTQATQQRFYSSNKDGEEIKFTAEKFKMNKGLKLDSEAAVQADRIIKGMQSESTSIAGTYERELINLYNISGRNGSHEDLNKFAYVLAAKNKLDVINSELTKAKDNSTRRKLLLDSKQGIEKSLANIKVDNAEAFINNFSKTHREEATITYTILKQLNAEASKYSKLCGEPSQNIFFLLTPSVKNTPTDNAAKAKYVMSMLARGNDPIKYNKDTHNYAYTEMPIYDGYNFMGSLITSINAVSKQAAIYYNSQRLKQTGMMENVSLTAKIFDFISNDDFISKINPAYVNDDARKACDLYLMGLRDLFSNDPSFTKQITQIQKASPMSMIDRYRQALVVLQNYIDASGITFEEASNIRVTNTGPEVDTKNYDNIVKAYNIYADTIAQLSGFCDDNLLNQIYTEITSSVPDGKVLVDRFGRKLDDLYALSENSLECYLEYMDGHFDDNEVNPKRSYMRKIVNKLLAGDLYTIDKTLADTMANSVFVKKPTGKIKNTLKKTSSFCVKALMSNPFKLIDRFVKFTMFDTATLSTANANTILKQPQAFMDLRAYFSSKGVAQSKNLEEFLYTQGIKLTSDNFDTIYNNSNSSEGFNPLKTYTDMTGNFFTYQTLATRYAYWLATKEAIENGDYSVLGSAYFLKDKIKSLDAVYKDELEYNENGAHTVNKQKVSKAGQQAAFAMAQNIGAPNDFPELAKSLNNYGAVFTTFPLAAMRWGMNEARSLGTIAQELFKGQFNSTSAKWLFRNGGGIIGTFMAESLLIALIADMFGIQSMLDKEDDEDQDERVKEWKETGALPNIMQTLFTGQPIMDTYSSMNIGREVKGMVVDPFINGDTNATGGISRFFYKNILSHANPIAKSATEIALGKDLIDDKIIDTKDKYNMMENVIRKMSSYVIGSAGANAFINAQKDYNGLGDNFWNGLTAAVAAECGNTKVYKENLKNYYKSLNKLNSYLYDGSTNDYVQSNEMTTLKKEIRELISDQAKISSVYSLINKYLQSGFSAQEIRSAMRSCSIQYKLEQVTDIDDLQDRLTDASFANIKTAIEFENYMYPWLDDGLDYLDNYIKQNKSSYNNLNYYSPRYYNNSTSYKQNHYQDLTYNSNGTYRKSPMDTYSESQRQQAYNKQQAEYKRRQQQYGGKN